MDRVSKYRGEWTAEIQTNGSRTVEAINPLLQVYQDETGIELTEVSSGWRPQSVNDATANSGAHSKHILALAVDVRDASGAFPRWCARHPARLQSLGLHMEDWHWTPTWCHLQPVPPASGKTMYYPFDPAEHPPAIPLSEQP
jgi:hypothetical protein